MTGLGLNVVVALEHLTYKIQSGLIPDFITDLVGYWKYNELVDGVPALDSSGNARTLTEISGLTIPRVAGILNNAIETDQVTKKDGLERYDDAISPNGGDFSIFVWVYPHSADYMTIVSRSDGTMSALNSEFFLNLDVDFGNNVSGYINLVGVPGGDSINSNSDSTHQYVLNQWNLIFFGHDSINKFLHMSVNGSPIFTKPYGPDSMIATQVGYQFAISSDIGISFTVDGLIDETAYFNRLLAQDAVDYLWDGGAGRSMF